MRKDFLFVPNKDWADRIRPFSNLPVVVDNSNGDDTIFVSDRPGKGFKKARIFRKGFKLLVAVLFANDVKDLSVIGIDSWWDKTDLVKGDNA